MSLQVKPWALLRIGGLAVYVGSPVGPAGSIRRGDRVRVIRIIRTGIVHAAARIIPASAPATSKRVMRESFDRFGVGVDTDFLIAVPA